MIPLLLVNSLIRLFSESETLPTSLPFRIVPDLINGHDGTIDRVFDADKPCRRDVHVVALDDLAGHVLQSKERRIVRRGERDRLRSRVKRDPAALPLEDMRLAVAEDRVRWLR